MIEIKAGLMVIISLAAVALFIGVVRGMRPPEQTQTFYASFTDTAGLNKGADVRFGGAKVGWVRAIALDPNDQSRLRVEARVRADTPVNAKSEAFITAVSLTAEKHLEISTGDKNSVRKKDGEEIPSKQGGLFDQADELARSVRSLVKDVEQLMGVKQAQEKEAKGEGKLVPITSIFEDVDITVKKGSDLVERVSDTVTDSRKDISTILTKLQELQDAAKNALQDLNGMLSENRDNVKGTMEGVRAAVNGVQPLIDRVGRLSERLDDMADSLESTLDNAASLSDNAHGLLENSRPAVEDAVLDLRETVRHLKTFARTMAEQPQAVIRGKGPEGRK